MIYNFTGNTHSRGEDGLVQALRRRAAAGGGGGPTAVAPLFCGNYTKYVSGGNARWFPE